MRVQTSTYPPTSRAEDYVTTDVMQDAPDPRRPDSWEDAERQSGSQTGLKQRAGPPERQRRAHPTQKR